VIARDLVIGEERRKWRKANLPRICAEERWSKTDS